MLRFVHIVPQAIQLIDKPAFRRLLQYTRSSLTEKDIPHRTKLTDTIKSRAMTVVDTIKERLAVSFFSYGYQSFE